MKTEVIERALRRRGVAPPRRDHIADYLASLNPEQAALLLERIRRIEFGIDQADDIPALVADIARRPEHKHGDKPRAGGYEPVHAPTVQRPARNAKPTGQKAPTDAEGEELQFLRGNGVHVYGRQAALKIELDTLARASERSGYTIQIEGARKSAGTGFDWVAKIPFQLTRRELPLLASFLLGFAGPKLELRGHGPANDKSLFIEDQGRVLFVRLQQKARTVAVPVEGPDVHAFAELCLLALQLNRPGVDGHMQMLLLRRVGAMAIAEAAQ